MHASDVCIDKLAMFISQNAFCIVDPLSSKDAAIVVDFHQFTDCHLEAILDMNNVANSAAIFYHHRRERCSSDHRCSLSEPGSARYSSTLSLATVWSNYQTLYNDFFEVYITKTVTLSPNVQIVLWPVSFSGCKSHDQSFFVFIGQSPHSWRIPLRWP